MKNCLFLSIILLFIGYTYASNPVKIESGSLHQKKKFITSSIPFEKIFLHLDRPNYMQGDTIWFKVYSWFGFDQLPDTVNKVMHVELLNKKDSILTKKKLLIQSGTSIGEFALDKSIESGEYLIRAYTRWMQNENAGEPFYQIINIGSLNQNFHVDCSTMIIKGKEKDSVKVALHFYEINQQGDLKSDFSHKVDYKVRIGDQQLNIERSMASGSNSREQILKFPLPGKKDSLAELSLSVKEDKLLFKKHFIIPIEDGLDLQFFPEGGSLISGVRNRIAFKAVGVDGLGREIKGVLKSEGGETISNIASFHKGMGDFYLTPEKGKKYYALIYYGNKELKYSLPETINSGCTIKIEKSDSAFSAKVLYTPELENSKMYLTGSSHEKLRFVSMLKLNSDSSWVNIPIELLSEGISKITLLSDSFKALCERLVYIDKKERFKIEVKTDSASYGTRSKVILHIRTINTDGEPVPANLSLSVTDKEQVKGGEYLTGISTYKLLESELKGRIEDPGFYFRGDIVNSKALDLLLLTQGYRKFLTESTRSQEIKFYPERSFEIRGKVTLRDDKKKSFDYSSLGLTVLCPSDKTFFDQTRPDTTGRFSFQLPIQYGRPLSLLRAYTANGKLTREKLPKEKSFKGDILLDEETKPKFEIPKLSVVITSIPLVEYVQQIQETKRNEISKLKNGDIWHLNLPEITITGKNKDKEWYTRFEDEAKKIVDLDSIDPTGKKFGNVYDLLMREFGAREHRLPGVRTIFLPSVCIGPDWYYPIYLLNGKQYFTAGEDESNDMKKRQADTDTGYANTSQEIGQNPNEQRSSRFVTLLNNLSQIKVSEIKKIMVIPPGNITYHYADPNVLHPDSGSPIMQSMVVLETYSKPNFYRGDPDGIKTFILEGLDSPRNFYSPKYEGLNKTIPDYDSRATLLWKPVLRTNEKGESEVEFYTSDRKNDFQITVRGIEIFNGSTGEYSK